MLQKCYIASMATQAKSLLQRYAFLPWLMCALGAVFYFYEYLLRVSPSVMTNQLMLAYHINAAALGNLTAFYYYIYAPMQLPVGVLMDRYGPRRLLTMAALSCSIGAYFFASSTHLGIAEFGRFLIGFGSAFAFVGVLKLATVWLPPERFGMVSGMTMALGTVGGMFGEISLTNLVHHEGWRLTTYISACIGVALTLVIFFVIRDGIKNARSPQTRHEQLRTWRSGFIGMMHILRNPQMWVNGFIGGLMYLSTSVFTEFWGISYLKQAYHYSPEAAATCISTIFAGWAVGGPVVGWLSDRLRQRRILMTIGAAVAAVLISIVFYVPGLPVYAVYTLFFFFGVFSSAQVLAFAVGREISPPRAAATAIAFTNMLVMVGGMIFQPVVGVLLDYFWSGKVVGGIHAYSTGAFQLALSVIPVGLVITVFLTFLLKETYCKLRDENSFH